MTKAISQPSRRIYRTYAVEATRTAEADMSIPSAADHDDHVERVLAALPSGYPVMKL